MPEFLHLPRQDRADILNTVSSNSGQGAEVLEKDIWVCWALEALFRMPDCPSMVFKGGTSLSKVYNVIDRFSEDIDITIDYRDLGIVLDPLKNKMSRTKRDQFKEDVEGLVIAHIQNTLLPYFKECLKEFSDDEDDIRIDENQEALLINYPSALDDESDYVQRRILLEFGARNLIEPSKCSTIFPLLHEHSESLTFPTPTVPVLAAERTFWEKATLIHAETTRSNPSQTAGLNSKSRHWYDLLMLYEHEIGSKAIKDIDLLRSVIHVKTCFFHQSGVDYTLCERGQLNLIPQGLLIENLKQDYQRMTTSSMFRGTTALPFDDLMDRLSEAQNAINAKYAQNE